MPGSKFPKTFLELVGFVTIGGVIALGTNSSSAQMTPDNTLPNNSNVQLDGSTFNITGGTQAGTNLFHSFQEFSVPTGREAFFNNAAGIQNIISRVTGGSVSNVDGLIRTNGTANLFLINPNGIIFGPNASLSIGGSFIGSTASSLNFADGTQFNTLTPQSTPLLTVSVPTGLGFGANPGRIQVLSNGQNAVRAERDAQRILKVDIDDQGGLRVQPNQTLALVGGDIALENGRLSTAGGRIELGSVAEGLVNLTRTDMGWTLGYEDVQNFQDINLSQQAIVDASGNGAGDIQLYGRRLILTNGSRVENNTLGTKAGGTFVVAGSLSVELSGVSSKGVPTTLGAQVYPGASGTGSKLTIKTGRLTVKDGAQVSLGTVGEGAAGSLEVLADELVEVSGSTEVTDSGLYATSFSPAVGNSGNLIIKTGRLIVRDGGHISTGTLGKGSAGDLEVSATDSIEVVGTAPNKFPSSLGGSVEPGATGSGGNITLSTQRLTVRDGAFISTGTSGKGSGGNLSLKADSVDIIGGSSRFGQGGLSSQSRGVGKSGNLTIEARKLSVRDGALVTVRGRGAGNAGFLQINADIINLNNTGSITAASASGEGGNIYLQSSDLRLRNSNITTSAGGSGNGGNITINTNTLAALENSGITANAFEGRGGNIKINAIGVFLSPNSKITATSERGIDGTVEINAPEPNFTRTAVVVKGENIPKFGGLCGKYSDAAPGEFFITGSGGMPPSLFGILDGSVSMGWHDPNESKIPAFQEESQPIQTEDKYIEAQGWVWNPDGTLRLVDEPTPETTGYTPQATPTCNQIGKQE